MAGLFTGPDLGDMGGAPRVMAAPSPLEGLAGLASLGASLYDQYDTEASAGTKSYADERKNAALRPFMSELDKLNQRRESGQIGVTAYKTKVQRLGLEYSAVHPAYGQEIKNLIANNSGIDLEAERAETLEQEEFDLTLGGDFSQQIFDYASDEGNSHVVAAARIRAASVGKSQEEVDALTEQYVTQAYFAEQQFNAQVKGLEMNSPQNRRIVENFVEDAWRAALPASLIDEDSLRLMGLTGDSKGFVNDLRGFRAMLADTLGTKLASQGVDFDAMESNVFKDIDEQITRVEKFFGDKPASAVRSQITRDLISEIMMEKGVPPTEVNLDAKALVISTALTEVFNGAGKHTTEDIQKLLEAKGVPAELINFISTVQSPEFNYEIASGHVKNMMGSIGIDSTYRVVVDMAKAQKSLDQISGFGKTVVDQTANQTELIAGSVLLDEGASSFVSRSAMNTVIDDVSDALTKPLSAMSGKEQDAVDTFLNSLRGYMRTQLDETPRELSVTLGDDDIVLVRDGAGLAAQSSSIKEAVSHWNTVMGENLPTTSKSAAQIIKSTRYNDYQRKTTGRGGLLAGGATNTANLRVFEAAAKAQLKLDSVNTAVKRLDGFRDKVSGAIRYIPEEYRGIYGIKDEDLPESTGTGGPATLLEQDATSGTEDTDAEFDPPTSSPIPQPRDVDVEGRTNDFFTILPEEVRSDEGFLTKAEGVANRIGAPLEHLMAVMSFETGHTFNPAEKNKAGSGGTGLIQFMKDTAEDLGTTIEELSSMTREEQLDWVEKYFSQPWLKKRLDRTEKTIEDLYMAVIWPAAVDKPNDYVMFEQGTKQYEQNIGLDTTEDGKITKEEVAAKVVNHWNEVKKKRRA